MFTKMNSKTGRCKQRRLFLRGALVLAGSIAAFASDNSSPEVQTCSQCNESAAKLAYAAVRDVYRPYRAAKRKHEKLLEEMKKLLDEKDPECPAYVKYTYEIYEKQKDNQQCAFATANEIPKPEAGLGVAKYRELQSLIVKTSCSVEKATSLLEIGIGMLKALKHQDLSKLKQKQRRESRSRRRSPKRASDTSANRMGKPEQKHAENDGQLEKPVDEAVFQNKDAQDAYGMLQELYHTFHKQLKPSYDDKLRQLNTLCEEIAKVERDTVYNGLKGVSCVFEYQFFDNLVDLKKGVENPRTNALIHRWGMNPFYTPSIPELPANDFAYKAYMYQLRDKFTESKTKLGNAIKLVEECIKQIEWLRLKITLGQKRKEKELKKRQDEGDIAAHGGWTGNRRRLKTIQSSSSSGNLLIMLAVILSLAFCANIVQKFIRSKRRASFHDAKRLPLNTAETMV